MYKQGKLTKYFFLKRRGDTMSTKSTIGYILAGTCAGLVTGILGAGGGMVLIPLLQLLAKTPEESLFPSSVAIILPTVIAALLSARRQLPILDALPYLIGSCLGGVAAGIWGQKIPTVWLHRFLGILVLWGGVRYLW